ncbi:MAG TPA: ABC transporter ATP-binding protein [Anaerolineae bacterium]|nr:ABC transporter ATP-binding protein [Anaerolineae bacterium]
MRGITKQFPGVLANDHVDLCVEQGEIHALVGENGAGKTTLMRILYGMETADEGRIILRGKEVRIPNPQVAISLGIGMVHQHFQLIPSLTVAENIVLNLEPRHGIFFDHTAAVRAIEDLSARFGLQVDPKARVADLSVGEQQRVEILKLLYRHAELVILDEPTAVLTPQEIQDLFAVMRRLSNEGCTIIFITHKLGEVLEISSRVTVLRRGRVTGVLETAKTNEMELARLMVGREILTMRKDVAVHADQETILTVEGLEVLDDRGLTAVHNVSFEVRCGEIVGIAGVEGNGQRELVEALAGLRPALHGCIRLNGADITNASVRARRERGLAVIPANRSIEGVSLPSTIAENLISTRYHRAPYSHRGFLNPPAIGSFARDLMARFNIGARSPHLSARVLSGGNLQRVVVARELATMPRGLIAAHPTRGLDVSAANAVHREMLKFSREGLGILLVSADLEEILNISDRILVLYRGEIVGEVRASEANQEELGMLMAGRIRMGKE